MLGNMCIASIIAVLVLRTDVNIPLKYSFRNAEACAAY